MINRATPDSFHSFAGNVCQSIDQACEDSWLFWQSSFHPYFFSAWNSGYGLSFYPGSYQDEWICLPGNNTGNINDFLNHWLQNHMLLHDPMAYHNSGTDCKLPYSFDWNNKANNEPHRLKAGLENKRYCYLTAICFDKETLLASSFLGSVNLNTPSS